MIKTIRLTALLFISLNGHSQVLELKELKSRKTQIELEIENLNDRLNTLNKEIDFIENQIENGDSEEWVEINVYAELYERPSIFSPTLHTFKSKTKVLLLSTEKNFLYVRSAFGEGYVQDRTLSNSRNLSQTPTANTAKSYISPSKSTYRSTYSNSRNYIRGPRGGCYYINSNGNKTYVARNKC